MTIDRIEKFFCISILVILTTSSSPSAEEIYQFVDRNGVIHFTNVPVDLRYKPLKKLKKTSYRNRYAEKELHQLISELSSQHEVNPALIKAIIKVESDFDTTAISVAGAQGLMQLMPMTANRLGVLDPFDPRENIEGGIRYFKTLLDTFNNNTTLALAAYHAGENNVLKYNGLPPIPQTKRYVDKVIGYYKQYSLKSSLVKNNSNYIYRVSTVDGKIIYTNTPERYHRYKIDTLR